MSEINRASIQANGGVGGSQGVNLKAGAPHEPVILQFNPGANIGTSPTAQANVGRARIAMTAANSTSVNPAGLEALGKAMKAFSLAERVSGGDPLLAQVVYSVLTDRKAA